ncbi:MAG: LuxR C-terminal-related transcriptional regulator [Phormidesmis sp.]
MNNNIQLAPSQAISLKATLSQLPTSLQSPIDHQLRIVTTFRVEQSQLYVVAIPPLVISDLEATEPEPPIEQTVRQFFAREKIAKGPNKTHISVIDRFESGAKNYAVVKVTPLPPSSIPDATAATLLVHQNACDHASLRKLLTPREQEIICLIAVGLVNKQIASRLDISIWTVSAHLRRIFIKLKVDTRAAVVYQCAKLIQSWE